jgi:hypothetical protein
VAVGTEAVGERREEPGPRHEVREQEVLDAVEQLGVGDVRVVAAGARGQRRPDTFAEHLPCVRSRLDGHLGVLGPEHGPDDLDVVERAAEVLAAHADRGDHPADVGAVDVVLGQRVGGRGQELGVDGHRVVRLDEGFERDLPVARHRPDDVGAEVALPQRPRREVRGEVLEVVVERWRLGVDVDEHEPAPRPDLGLRQAERRLLDLREVPRRGDLEQAPVEVPAEPVVRAPEGLDVTRAGAELGAAVEARVVERRDRVRAGADDDERPVGDLVEDRVADLGDLLLTARHLPDVAPHVVDLALVEVSVEVARGRDAARLEEAGGRRPEAHGDRARLLVEQRLVEALTSGDLVGAGAGLGCGHLTPRKGSFPRAVTGREGARVASAGRRSRGTARCRIGGRCTSAAGRP